MFNLSYLYLLSPLHTGGTTQEGNLLGIARESHTNLPYIPSSTIRGKLRSSIKDETEKFKLFGTELGNASTTLEQGDIWIGDGSILWFPIPSLSHGVVWISSPLLLRRWTKLNNPQMTIPSEYSCNFKKDSTNIYLKDAQIKADQMQDFSNFKDFGIKDAPNSGIERVLVLPDKHCATVIQMGLWRQVKIKLNQHKTVDGGFRYEEAIPPDTLMYFPWGTTSQANGSAKQSALDLQSLLTNNSILQIGGQESLGRGFCEVCSSVLGA